MKQMEHSETTSSTHELTNGEAKEVQHAKKTQQEHENTDIKNRTKLFLVYCLMAVCWAASEPIGASLFIQLQNQLNTTESKMTFCFVTRSISSIIASIITGQIVDHFTHSHRYVVIPIIGFIATMIYLPYCTNLIAMHVIFGMIGWMWSTLSVSIFVYTLRLYPEYRNGGHKIYIIFSLYGISKTVFPLILDASIKFTDEYIYPIYLLLVLFVFVIILLLCFKTPKHDKLRTIKAELEYNKNKTKNKEKAGRSVSIDINNLSENISEILNKDKLNRFYEIFLIFLLSIMILSYSSFQEFYITFSALYCNGYLQIGDEYGRYLISMYYAGQLSYRILSALIPKRKEVAPKISLFLSYTVLMIFGLIFIFFDANVIWIHFLWFLSGFFASSIDPEVTIWTELIVPFTGTISVIYGLTNACGEIIAVFGVGILIDIYSISILKYLIFAFILNGFLFFVITVIGYALYLKHKKSKIWSIINTNSDHDKQLTNVVPIS